MMPITQMGIAYMSNNIKDLEHQIIKARDAYYNGEAQLDDASYDALEVELRKIDPNNELLKKIGAEPVSGWKKIKHQHSMGSLDKAQNEEEFQAWVTRHNLQSEPFVITEKLDGISIEVVYLKGSLQHASSRGNGEVGEDFTTNVVKMKGIQRILKEPFTGSLRGEIILTHADFAKYFTEYKNPRNAASGTAKRFDGSGCEHLTVMFYDAIGDIKFKRYSEVLGFIESLELNLPHCIRGQNKNEIELRMQQVVRQRKSINWDIDGLVVRVDDMKKFEELGYTNLNPKGAIAYKFEAGKRQTTVKSIEWQIGMQNRLTPVAVIEPIDIGGVTITNVSLHTAGTAIELQAGVGSKILVARANDVIPAIIDVLEKKTVEAPTKCPICNSKLGWDGMYLECQSSTCPNILHSAIKVWCQRLDILHLGDSLIDNLIKINVVKTLPDLYKIQWKQISHLIGDGIAERAKKSIDSKRSMNLAQLIAALNIKMCLTSGKDIVSAGYNTVDKFLSLDEEKLSNINGIGSIKAATIATGIKQLTPVIKELVKYVTIEEPKMGKLIGQSICFTGSAELPRKELQAMAEGAGLTVKSSVGKDTTYLCITDPASTSSKAVKARSLGVKLISESDFVKLVS